MNNKTPLPSPRFLDSPKSSQNPGSSQSNLLKSVLMPGLVSSGLSSTCKKIDEFIIPPSQLPSQKNTFGKQKFTAPHFSSPQGMLMPSHMQPPPMYGPRGPTIPPKYMNRSNSNLERHRNFWCESCEQEFQSLTELQVHKLEHKTCGVDGCSFTGLSEIIANHVEQTHSSGLYNKIKKLSTPEEISRWREERRKRYPTRANVELRRKAQEERMKRGEKLGMKKSRFGNKQDRRPIRNNGNVEQRIVLRKPTQNVSLRARNSTVKAKETKNIEKIKYKEMDVEPEQLCIGKLRPFKGTSVLEEYIRPKPKAVVPNALASLLGMYGSDEDYISNGDTESESETNKKDSESDDNCFKLAPNSAENVINQITEISIEKQDSSVCATEEICDTDHNLATKLSQQIENKCCNLKKLCNHENDRTNSDDDMPEEVPIQKQIDICEVVLCTQKEKPAEGPQQQTLPTQNAKCKNSKKRYRQRRNNKMSEPGQKKPKPGLLDYTKGRTRRQNTMLEKLLEPSIIHERNVLLQCVRFVVQNNFFGIGDKKCI